MLEKTSTHTRPAIKTTVLMHIRRKTVEVQGQLLPGCVFFRTENDEHLTRINNVLNLPKRIFLRADGASWEIHEERSDD